ncbi:MAG TPA: hypothetical protein VMT55_00940 [Candidatus Sulfotelmatobacter sp.]|nr:hypothetical protein [Candidatus Sulfotelmatobacter sp.]
MIAKFSRNGIAKKAVVLLLLLFFCCSPAFAAANKEKNPVTEFDITFWQTLPFAVFWGYVAASQLASGTVNWSPIFTVALAISAGNAYYHARQVAR